MSLVRVGSITLGQACPLTAQAQGEIDAAVATSLNEILSRIAGLTALLTQMATVPPTIAGSITVLTGQLASLQASLTIAPPALNLAALATLLAALEATKIALEASARFSLQLNGTLSFGVDFYRWDGRIGSLGGEVSAQMGAGLPGGAGPNQLTSGVLLIARDNGAAAALAQMFA